MTNNNGISEVVNDFLDGKSNESEVDNLTRELIAQDDPEQADGQLNELMDLVSQKRADGLAEDRSSAIMGLAYALDFRLTDFDRLVGKKSALEINKLSTSELTDNDYIDIETGKWIRLHEPFKPMQDLYGAKFLNSWEIDRVIESAFEKYIKNPGQYLVRSKGESDESMPKIEFFSPFSNNEKMVSQYNDYLTYLATKKTLEEKIKSAGKTLFSLRWDENHKRKNNAVEEVYSQLNATQIPLFSENIILYGQVGKDNPASLFAAYSELFSQNQLVGLSDVLKSFVGRVRTTELEEWQIKVISNYFQDKFREIKGFDTPTKLSHSQSYNSRYIAADMYQDIGQVLKGELTGIRQTEALTKIVRNVEAINTNTAKALGYLSSIGNTLERMERQNHEFQQESLNMQFETLRGIYALGRVMSSFRFEHHTLLTDTYAGPRLSFDNAINGLTSDSQATRLN